MRYNSSSDSTLLRRQSMGPVLAVSQRRYALPVPGRGTEGYAARSTLRGFGALTSGGGGPPVGAGAGAGAAIGASQGASYGAVAGPIGAAIGAVIGAIGGAIAGSINKKDPEQYNFDQAVAIWQQNPDAVYAIGNKYLPLAGLFDLSLKNPHIPIYQKYGRMGEQRFVNDMVQQVYQAGLSGRITQNDTAISVFNKVIQPWIDSWGYGPMQDPHADLINRLMTGMILDYVTGAWKNAWFARGGDFPFGNLPMFVLAAPQQTVTASPTPSPQPVQPTNQQPSLAPSAQIPNSPDGSYILWNSTSYLQTAAGTFMYSQNFPSTAGQLVLLNGGSTRGNSLLMTVIGGNLYTYDGSGTWHVWQNGWAATTAPTNAPLPNIPPVPGVVSPITMRGSTTPSTTPPAVGAPLPFALDADTHNMVQLPDGATYGGLDANGNWIIVYTGGNNAGKYLLQSGSLNPIVTQTNKTAVPTTPPALGTAISYVRDNATGKMVQIPPGGVYAGVTSTNGWLVSYGASSTTPGTFESNNGQLTPYSSSGVATDVPAGFTRTTQSAIINGLTYPLYTDGQAAYVWSGGSMIPYNTAAQNTGGSSGAVTTSGGGGGGGGGGGFYPGYTPQTMQQQSVTPSPATTSGGVDNSTLLMWGGAALGLYLLMA